MKSYWLLMTSLLTTNFKSLVRGTAFALRIHRWLVNEANENSRRKRMSMHFGWNGERREVKCHRFTQQCWQRTFWRQNWSTSAWCKMPAASNKTFSSQPEARAERFPLTSLVGDATRAAGEGCTTVVVGSEPSNTLTSKLRPWLRLDSDSNTTTRFRSNCVVYARWSKIDWG